MIDMIPQICEQVISGLDVKKNFSESLHLFVSDFYGLHVMFMMTYVVFFFGLLLIF